MEQTKVQVNGKEFSAIVYGPDTYVLWSALGTVPGFSKSYVNGEWQFTIPAGVDPALVAKAEGLLNQAVTVLQQPSNAKATLKLSKANLATLLITVLGGVKIALNGFGVDVISDQQVNDIANGIAALVTVAGPIVSYFLHRKASKKTL